MGGLSTLVDGSRVDAALAWTLVAMLLLAAVWSLLEGSALWAGFALVAAGVAIVPAVVVRDPAASVPPELLVLVVVPVVGRSYGPFTQVATYLAVAALALLVVVEIDAFSSAEMTPRFAVVFVVMTTMAVAAVWAIAQWLSDAYLATAFLGDKTDLMWDLVVATAAGGGAGLLFVGYFRRRAVGARRTEAPPEGERA